MSLGVLIVDDEAPARAKVRRLLDDDARFHVVGEAADGVEALEVLDTLEPDVVILDVQMPGLDGFQFLQALGDTDLVVVFSTAFDEHALRAFEAHAVDYLLKPYDEDRFRRAMDKAEAQYLGASARPPLAQLTGRATRLTLKTTAGAWVVIPLQEVIRFRVERKHTHVVLAGNHKHLVRRPLSEFEASLGPDFVRVHRTEIVRLSAVQRLEPLSHGDALVTFRDGTSSVLTRTYRADFVARWRG